jgi:hypothetical protein
MADCPFSALKVENCLAKLSLMIVTDYLQRFLRRVAPKRFYCEDALITTHNHDFLDESRFRKAYERGIKATEGLDNHNRWRVHIALWVARACASLEGDFVECGVNYGLTSSAIMDDLSWDRLGKTFWLIDSFGGVDEGQLTDTEKKSESVEKYRRAKSTGFYNTSVERCRQNFSEWKHAKVVQGWIPNCLKDISSSRIAFMHLDLNSGVPEIAAFEFFSTKFSPGALILLDDYGYSGHDGIHKAWAEAAPKLGIAILSLPTGQGLIYIPGKYQSALSS